MHRVCPSLGNPAPSRPTRGHAATAANSGALKMVTRPRLHGLQLVEKADHR